MVILSHYMFGFTMTLSPMRRTFLESGHKHGPEIQSTLLRCNALWVASTDLLISNKGTAQLNQMHTQHKTRLIGYGPSIRGMASHNQPGQQHGDSTEN